MALLWKRAAKTYRAVSKSLLIWGTAAPRYFVATRERKPLWETASGERVFSRREDAESHIYELERMWPELAGRLAIFEAYIVIGRESIS